MAALRRHIDVAPGIHGGAAGEAGLVGQEPAHRRCDQLRLRRQRGPIRIVALRRPQVPARHRQARLHSRAAQLRRTSLPGLPDQHGSRHQQKGQHPAGHLPPTGTAPAQQGIIQPLADGPEHAPQAARPASRGPRQLPPQPFAHEVEAEHGNKDERAGRDGGPRLENLPRVGQHLAQLGAAADRRRGEIAGHDPVRAADVVAEKTKRSHDHQRAARLEREQHPPQRHNLAQDMAEHRLRAGCAERARRLHVGLPLEEPRLLADQPRGVRPARGSQPDDERGQAALHAHRGDDGQRRDDGRDRQPDRDERVRDPAGRTCGPARPDADEQPQAQAHHRDERHKDECGPHAPQQTAQQVAAEAVRTQGKIGHGEGRIGRINPCVAHEHAHVRRNRVLRRQRWPGHGQHCNKQQQEQPHAQRPVARGAHLPSRDRRRVLV